jgi:hypothetical protein
MNHGLLNNLLFTEHRQVKGSLNYSILAPYGELFDILSPNPKKSIDPKIFDGYKVIFAMGGLELTKEYSKLLRNYVEAGGVLVMNVKDLNEFMPPDFFGVATKGVAEKGNKITNNMDGKTVSEHTFSYTPLSLKDAVALYSCGNSPLITKSKVGKGWALLVGTHYMIQDDPVDVVYRWGGMKRQEKPLLKFTGDFIAHLTAGLTPFEIRIRPEDRGDISWMISKKGAGWTVTMFNYGLEKELAVSNIRTAAAYASYDYKSLPFEIVCSAPVKDVLEQYEDRDVDYALSDGHVVVRETIKAGDIRVYDFQPQRIKLAPRERFVNHALKRPTTVSSIAKGYSAVPSVDGKCDNASFWQSSLLQKMPQWLQVDLGQIKTVDHIFVQFHCRDDRSAEVRQCIYKYYLEVSSDGRSWHTAIDEKNNEDVAHPMGFERWFEPVKARYVKLTVLRNTAMAGAQVVEVKVMGPERESYVSQRNSCACNRLGGGKGKRAVTRLGG